MIFKQFKKVILLSISYVFVYTVALILAFFTAIRTTYSWLRSSAGELTSTKRRELPPKCLNDSEYGEHCYIQVKNIKLHYVQNGDKNKPLMLFLHGFPEFWYSWRYQIKRFSSDYWTVAVDLRGFGDSEKPSGVSQYKIKYVVSDIQNLITALGREKCILVAHDWGAIIGYHFLLKCPEMVEQYVMINMHPAFAVPFKWIQLVKSWYIFLYQLPYIPEWYLTLKDFEIFDKIFKGFSYDDIEAYKFTFGKPGGFTYGLNYYRANLFKVIQRFKKPESITLPKGLLIYTDNDRYIDVSNFIASKDRLENLKLSFIKSGSHFLHQRKHEETNKIISNFLGIGDDDPGDGKSVQSNDTSSENVSTENK